MLDILIESDVVATSAVSGVICGRHCNHSMRANKLMYESLHCMTFKTFFDSLPPKERDEYMDVMNEINGEFPERAMDALCANEKCAKLCSKHADFAERQSAKNPMFAFRSSYIDMVQILPLFVRATRESDWKLHLSTMRLMMAWLFAYDHIHLARYLPSYWLEMVNLPFTRPSCHTELLC